MFLAFVRSLHNPECNPPEGKLLARDFFRTAQDWSAGRTATRAEEKSIYRFLQLLDIYPADPPGRWTARRWKLESASHFLTSWTSVTCWEGQFSGKQQVFGFVFGQSTQEVGSEVFLLGGICSQCVLYSVGSVDQNGFLELGMRRRRAGSS